MLGFVVIHGDFEHVIATNTDAMDLRGNGAGGLGLRIFAPGRRCMCGGGLMRFGHGRILARRAKKSVTRVAIEVGQWTLDDAGNASEIAPKRE